MQPEPVVLLWELTRACRLQCMHCTAGSQARRSPLELSTYEAYKTIDQIVSLAPREVVITGGDPLERADLFQLVDYARRRGLRPGITLVPSTGLTGAMVHKLRTNGIDRVIFSIDGPNPERHDALRGVRGHFTSTLQAIRWARTAGLAIEINTLVSRRVARDLPAIADLVAELGAVRWNLYFLVPVKASRDIEVLTAEEVEEVFERIFDASSTAPFQVRTFEAPHYARYVVQRAGETSAQPPVGEQFAGTTARNVIFVSHTGEISISPFVPVASGNVRYQPLSHLFRTNELFGALRDDNNLKGKCARCEYRSICGGSRARAFATTGDIFATDPLCAYQPQTGA